MEEQLSQPASKLGAATRAPDDTLPPSADQDRPRIVPAAHPESSGARVELTPSQQARLHTKSSHGRSPSTSVTDAPPFWLKTRQNRSVSTISYHSISQHRAAPISLEDRSDEQHDLAQGCWASSVSIDEYVVVAGATGVGAYIVWHCTVRTIKGGDLALRKRYSEFDRLRTNLVRAFPHAEAMIPQLPRKSVVSRFRPKFLELRKQGLSHFLNCVILNPEFAASPILKEFIFA